MDVGLRPFKFDDAIIRDVVERGIATTHGIVVVFIRWRSSSFDEAIFLREEVLERGVAAT